MHANNNVAGRLRDASTKAYQAAALTVPPVFVAAFMHSDHRRVMLGGQGIMNLFADTRNVATVQGQLTEAVYYRISELMTVPRLTHTRNAAQSPITHLLARTLFGVRRSLYRAWRMRCGRKMTLAPQPCPASVCQPTRRHPHSVRHCHQLRLQQPTRPVLELALLQAQAQAQVRVRFSSVLMVALRR